VLKLPSTPEDQSVAVMEGLERLQSRLTAVDLSADLTDYEQRRIQDRAKLQDEVGQAAAHVGGVHRERSLAPA